MRFHTRYPLLQCWLDLPAARKVMHAGCLAMARYEPAITSGARGTAIMDLVFSDGRTTAVLPNVGISAAMLLERERSPLIWPDAARVLGAEVLRELERLVLPWLESRTLARQANNEMIRRFSNAVDETHFESARSAGFLGAAPYVQSMAALAPYVYALRFCVDETVEIRDPRGAAGAAILALRTKNVRAHLGDEALNGLARVWFGREIFGETQERYGVAICAGDGPKLEANVTITLDTAKPESLVVNVASPVPMDTLVSFDPEDAPPVRSFAVKVNENDPLREVRAMQDTAVAGGSGGTILILLRDGFERANDTDADEARILATRLSAEGFAVDIASRSTPSTGCSADLVHVFGTRALEENAGALQQFRRAGVPVVATPSIPRVRQEAAWGPQVLQAVLNRSGDEALLEERLELLERRRLNTEDATSQSPPESLLANVDVAIVGCADEEVRLRDEYSFGGEIVRSLPYLGALGEESSPIAAIAGTAPFAFVHAAIEWRTSLPLLARAAAALRIPLVVAGQVLDVDALRFAQNVAPELVLSLPQATNGEIAAFYRSARVFVDVAWEPRGYYRTLRALASGCSVVGAGTSYASAIWPGVAVADPGSVSSLVQALGAAWNGKEQPAAADPAPAFSAVIFAYAKAQRMRVPA